MGMKEMHTDRRNTTFGQREEDSKITVERGKIKKTTTTMQDMTVITESGEEGCGAKGACSVQPGGGKYSCNQGNHTFSHKGSGQCNCRF